jgi:hypothetical protein
MTTNDQPPLVLLIVLGLVFVALFGAPYLSELVGAYWPRDKEPSALTWLGDGGIE